MKNENKPSSNKSKVLKFLFFVIFLLLLFLSISGFLYRKGVREIFDTNKQDFENIRKVNIDSRNRSFFPPIPILSEEDKEKLAEYEDLISQRDETIREKMTLEQQNLVLNNQLKLKQQEVSNKDKTLEKLKEEKNQLEANHQKKLKEKNGLITVLNREIKE